MATRLTTQLHTYTGTPATINAFMAHHQDGEDGEEVAPELVGGGKVCVVAENHAPAAPFLEKPVANLAGEAAGRGCPDGYHCLLRHSDVPHSPLIGLGRKRNDGHTQTHTQTHTMALTVSDCT
jgi:hypothetical protein